MQMIDNINRQGAHWQNNHHENLFVSTPEVYTSILRHHQRKLPDNPGWVHHFFNALVNVGHYGYVHCAGHYIVAVVLV